MPDIAEVLQYNLEKEGFQVELANRGDAGLEAVRRGAQDYLVKGQVGPELLTRSLRYAIERGYFDALLDTLSTAATPPETSSPPSAANREE